MADSTRIIATLEERWPDPPLYPADPELRDQALALEDFFDEEVGHPLRTLLLGDLEGAELLPEPGEEAAWLARC